MFSGLHFVVKQYFYKWSIEILRPLRVAIALPVPAQNCFSYLVLPARMATRSEIYWLLARPLSVVILSGFMETECFLVNIRLFLCILNTYGPTVELSKQWCSVFTAVSFFSDSVKQGNLGNMTELKLSWWKRAVKLVANHSRRSYYWVIWFEPAPQKRFIQGSFPISALQYTH